MRYIDDAVKLIEQSPHRDYFFEVAGHLIQSVPVTAFKLQKALQAVALAADRIDYEEIKQELRPDKVEQLENVLQDVRVRQVQRRSEMPMNPKQAADLLKEIAQQTRETGNLPLERVLRLAAELEHGTKTASEAAVKPADLLDRLASALDSPPEEGKDPSRVRLAAVLRRLASDEALKIVAADDEDEEKEGQDKTAGIEDEVLLAKFENLKSFALVSARSANGKRWKASLVNLAELVNQIGAILSLFGSDNAASKITAIYRAVRQTGMTAQRVMREQEQMQAEPMAVLAFNAPSIDEDVGADANLIAKFDYLKSLSIVSFRNASSGRWKLALMTIAEMLSQVGSILSLFGSTDIEPKIMAVYREIRQTALTSQRFMREHEMEPGLAVNAADEGLMTDPESIDPGEPVFGRASVTLGLEQVLMNARKAGVAFEGGNTKRMFFYLLGIVDGLGQVGRAFDLPDIGYLVRVYRQFARRSSGRPSMNFSAAEADKDSRFEEGKPADPTENMSKEDAKEWKKNTDKYEDKFKEAAESDKDSRFEEGKPADPTENMSEEDAKKWKEMTDEHKDQFKSASQDAWKA